MLSKCRAGQELVRILAVILLDIHILLPSLQKGAVVLLQGSGQRVLWSPAGNSLAKPHGKKRSH